MRVLLAVLLALTTLGLARPAAAEIRALIVAVSEYQDPIPSLEGPPNDAAALKTLLGAQGATDVTVIADRQAERDKYADANRAAIL